MGYFVVVDGGGCSCCRAAEGDRRSLNQEIKHLLISALGVRFEKPAVRAPEIEAQMAAWRKLAGKWDFGAEAAVDCRAGDFAALAWA